MVYLIEYVNSDEKLKEIEIKIETILHFFFNRMCNFFNAFYSVVESETNV